MTDAKEMKVVYLDPTKVKINPDIKRLREDLGDIDSLADSIKRTRQILPIVINKDNELVDGGRRLTACIFLGIKVKCVYEDTIDAYEMRELEIEANLHSKEFTPAEYALGVKELHRLKKLRNKDWRLEDTAQTMGKTKGSVIAALDMAALVEAFPELKKAKKKSEIVKVGKALRKLDTSMANLANYEKAVEEKKDMFDIKHMDFLNYCPTIKTGSVDILLTDPLYGIDADLVKQGIGSRTGGPDASGFIIPDGVDEALFYVSVLAKESFRFCTKDAHGYIFLAPEHLNTISDMFREAGWRVHVKPIIWIKREVGQCNVPASWPSSCYEMLIYIRKDDSRLVIEGQKDWIDCPPINPSDRIHPYEKPVPLLMDLLSRVATPGKIVCDPFIGSGASIEAAIKSQCFGIGCELSMEAYSLAIARLANLTKETEKENKNGK